MGYRLGFLTEDGTITQNSIYEPFGKQIPLMDGTNSRLGFISKEKDIESSLGDFGVRKYDEEIGRFTSIDRPHNCGWEKYLGYTPYHYCGNNPIRFFDRDGLKPGDAFASALMAVVDFAVLFNGKSILEDREYSTRLYSWKGSDGKKYYSYSEPVRGESGYSRTPAIPEGFKGEGVAHTHAAYDPRLKNWLTATNERDVNIHLTSTDTKEAAEGHKSPIWGIFPNGRIEVFDPKSGIIKEIPLKVFIPCDANAPKRKGNDNTVNDFDKQTDFLIKALDEKAKK